MNKKFEAMIIEYRTMDNLIDNITRDALTELIDYYELQFQNEINLEKRSAKQLVCYLCALRAFALCEPDDTTYETMFDFLDTSFDYLINE